MNRRVKDHEASLEPNRDYQLAAIEAVCDLFRGRKICRTDFTVRGGVWANQTSNSFCCRRDGRA